MPHQAWSELATGLLSVAKHLIVSLQRSPASRFATIDPSEHTSEPSAPLEPRGLASSTSAVAESTHLRPALASTSLHEVPNPHSRSPSPTLIPSTRVASLSNVLNNAEAPLPSTSHRQRIRPRSDYEGSESNEPEAVSSHLPASGFLLRASDSSEQHSRKRLKLDRAFSNGSSECMRHDTFGY